MKIAHIVCVFPPYGGGIGTTAYQQIKSLAKQGHQVTVFTPEYSNSKSLKSDAVDFEIEKIKPLLSFGKAGVLFQIIKKLNEFELVQLHHPFIGTSLLVWFWKKFLAKNTKLVVYYHMDLVGSGLKGLIFKLYSKIVTPLVLKSADEIFVSSKDYVEHGDIARFYFKNKEKFSIKPFCIDALEFKPLSKDEELMRNLQIAQDDKIVLFVASLDKAHYFKGLPLLLRAWQKLNLRNKKLIVVGDGDLRDFYQNLAKDLKIDDQVIFAGYVSDKDLVKYYNLADVFVLPSIDKSEAFGVVTLLAQSCGKPAIVSDLAGVRTVIESNKTGLVFDKNNLDDLIAKIEALLINDDLRLEMGNNARQRVLEKFDQNSVEYSYDKR